MASQPLRARWILALAGLLAFPSLPAQAAPPAFGKGQMACFFFTEGSPTSRLIDSVLMLRTFEFRAHLDQTWHMAMIVPRAIAAENPRLALEVNSPAGESLTRIADAKFRRMIHGDYMVAIPEVQLTFREGDPFGDYQVHARIRSSGNRKLSYSGVGYLQLGL